MGCKYSDKIVYHELFSSNPDLLNPELMTTNGVYSAHCGLNNVHLSWGHDEVRWVECAYEMLLVFVYHCEGLPTGRSKLHYSLPFILRES